MKCDVPEPRLLLVEHKAQLDKYKVRYSLFFGSFFAGFFFFFCMVSKQCHLPWSGGRVADGFSV